MTGSEEECSSGDVSCSREAYAALSYEGPLDIALGESVVLELGNRSIYDEFQWQLELPSGAKVTMLECAGQEICEYTPTQLGMNVITLTTLVEAAGNELGFGGIDASRDAEAVSFNVVPDIDRN